jgi:acetyltransferase-like isoleucine patch superfamily enzyme
MSQTTTSPDSILATARRLQQDGRLDEALDILTNVSQEEGSLPDVVYFLAQLLIAKGRIAEALHELERVIHVFPGHTWALNDLGVIHHQQGRPEKAIQYFQQSLQAANNPRALANLLSVLTIVGHEEEASALASMMRERFQSDDEMKNVLVQFESSRPSSRVKSAGKAIPATSGDGTSEVKVGKAHAKECPVINVVYDGLLPEHAQTKHRGMVSVKWSPVPLAGCDVYAYVNASSYRGPQDGLSVLLVLEPMVVLPGEYTEEVWKNFDCIFTMCDALAQQGGKFRKIPFPRSDWAMEWAITEHPEEREAKYPLEGRKRSVCMINGNKASLVDGELYSERVKVAQWFYKNSKIPFEVFGNPPFPLPNYKGGLAHGTKLDTLRRYRWSLCYENTDHPVFSSGYVSEKILDCLETRTIPIYRGASNIDQYIPRKCFIDARQFRSYQELNAFLEAMTEEDVGRIVRDIDAWVGQGGLRHYSWHTLYDLLVNLYAVRSSSTVGSVIGTSVNWTDGLVDGLRDRTWKELRPKQLWTWDDLARPPLPEKEEHFVHPTAQLERTRLVKLGKHSEIHDYVIIRTYNNPVVIGEYTQINPFTVIYGGSGVYIGDNVMMAPHCMIAAGNHDFVQIEKPMRFAGNVTKGPVIIEDNVWIGANCTIADGVRIGRDAVVSANSLVTKDVAPYDIVRGVPAKPVGNRLENARRKSSKHTPE